MTEDTKKTLRLVIGLIVFGCIVSAVVYFTGLEDTLI